MNDSSVWEIVYDFVDMGKIYILCLFICVLGHYPHHDTLYLLILKENSTKNMHIYIIYMAYALKLGGLFSQPLAIHGRPLHSCSYYAGLVMRSRPCLWEKTNPRAKASRKPSWGPYLLFVQGNSYIMIYLYIQIYIYISYNYNMAHYGSKIYWCPKKWIYI